MQANRLEEGDLVLCTVDRIIGTVVFVKIEGFGREGSIVTSEIAPGRIRNLRDYVVPNKKIVCKILRISQNGNIDLSLRRVKQKEAKEVIEKVEQERSYKNIFKSLLKENYAKAIEDIEKNQDFYEFIQDSKKSSKELEEIIGKENAKKILEIINLQKQRTIISKKEIRLSTNSPNGLELIKELLQNVKNSEITYLAAGRYLIQTQDSDPKLSGNKLKQVLSQIEEQAKKLKIEFSIKEK